MLFPAAVRPNERDPRPWQGEIRPVVVKGITTFALYAIHEHEYGYVRLTDASGIAPVTPGPWRFRRQWSRCGRERGRGLKCSSRWCRRDGERGRLRRLLGRHICRRLRRLLVRHGSCRRSRLPIWHACSCRGRFLWWWIWQWRLCGSWWHRNQARRFGRIRWSRIRCQLLQHGVLLVGNNPGLGRKPRNVGQHNDTHTDRSGQKKSAWLRDHVFVIVLVW